MNILLILPLRAPNMPERKETREQIEAELVKQINPEEVNAEAWVSFVDFVHISDYWGTQPELIDAWLFFDAGYLAGADSDNDDFEWPERLTN